MAAFSPECILYIETKGEKCYNTTVVLNIVYVDLAAIWREIKAELMPPTLQPVNANQ